MAVNDIVFSNQPIANTPGGFTQIPGIPGSIPPPVTPTAGFAPPAPPDYAAILAADPFYNQLQKDLMAASVSDAASRDAARKRALIQFGEVPSGIDFSLTPEIQALIQQNTDAGLSTTARLRQADVDARRGIRNALNARGTYNSGETGYQMQREATDYARAQYDARNDLLNALEGYNSQFLQAERDRQMALSDAALAAFLRGDYGGGGGDPGGGFEQPPPPGNGIIPPGTTIDLSGDVKPLPPRYMAPRPVYGGFNVKAQ